jgi:hypothetical protein
LGSENEIMEEPQFFWELIQKDGTVIEIPPEAVETVKRRWDSGQVIHTNYQGSIPPNQIAAFRPTEKVANQQPILEEVARAFNEPVIEERDGEEVVKARWVKKRVTQQKWDKYYSPHQSYKKLNEDMGMITIAFRLPVHLIDLQNVQYCTDEEVSKLQQ